MIDTHCHIDLYNDPQMVLDHCEEKGITVLAMTNLPSHFELGYPHVRRYKKIRLALGMHPLYASKHEEEFKLFFDNLHKTSYIGEIGLDYSRDGFASKDVQLTSFIKILKAIEGQDKVLSLHSRRAEKQILKQLLDHHIKSAIFHWYSGPVSLIDEIVKSGYFFSINPAMTISSTGQKIISKIPRNFLLTETDGPFVSIHGRETMPVDVNIVIEYLAKLWMMPRNDVSAIITSNFRKLILGIRN